MVGKRPILVTGAHRTGTTWVGKMIAASQAVRYVHEPFNLNHSRCDQCGAEFEHWFTYVTEENEARYYQHLKHTLGYDFKVIDGLKRIRSPQSAHKFVRAYNKALAYQTRRVIPLVKDPIAIFSAEWLAKRFKMNVLVLIRHPAAFASSLKRMNWTHPFSDFLQQPRLMQDQLSPFEAQIKAYADQEYDIIDQAILLWRIIHYVISKYQQQHQNWIFLRHEDISRDPLGHFETLFKRFGLDYSPQIRNTIQEHSAAANPTEAPVGEYLLIKRDSQSITGNWKQTLSKAEINRIRCQVEEISPLFYADDEW